MQLSSKLKSTTIASRLFCKGPGKREDTLLPTQMFPRLPARATFVADTNVLSGTQILCPGHKKCFWFRSETVCVRNNVSQFAQPKKHHGQQCVLVYQEGPVYTML